MLKKRLTYTGDVMLAMIDAGWTFDDAYNFCKKLPNVPAQDKPCGTWRTTEAYPHRLYCSECYSTVLPNAEYIRRWGMHYNFCPVCGARLDNFPAGKDE